VQKSGSITCSVLLDNKHMHSFPLALFNGKSYKWYALVGYGRLFLVIIVFFIKKDIIQHR